MTDTPESAKQEIPSAASAAPAPAATEAAVKETAKPAGEPGEGPRKVKVGDEEFEADERGDIKLPVKAFESRLRRASKAALQEAFGTTDVESIKKKIARAKELEEKAEEASRAQMSELERLKADLDKRNAELEEAKGHLDQLQSEREFERVDGTITTVATRHVDPQYADVATIKFGQFVRDELTNKEARSMTKEDIDTWFAEYAKDHPALANKKDKPEPKPEPRKEPLNHGATDRKVAPKPDGASHSKTAKLGAPNSMSDAEWTAYRKANGISY